MLPQDVNRAFFSLSARDVRRGERSFLYGDVGELVVEPRGTSALVDAIVGSERGPCSVSMAFKKGPKGRMVLVAQACSCPMNAGCHHVAAALFELLERVRRKEGRPAPAPRRAPHRLSNTATMWLGALELGASLGSAPEGPSLRYVLQRIPEGDGHSLELKAEQVWQGEDGRVERTNLLDPRRLDWLSDPAVIDSERYLGKLLGEQVALRVAIEGRAGAALLAAFVATGRLFFRDQGHRPPRDTLIAPGERAPAELSFRCDAYANQHPSLRDPSPSHLALPTAHPFYLDTTTGQVGILEVPGVPQPLVEAWLRGAPCTPEDAEALGEALRTLRRSKKLPVPIPKLTRRSFVAPRLVVRLEAGEPPAGSGPQRAWIRRMVDYDGLRVDPGIPAPSIARETPRAIELVPRDLDAEERFERRLHAAGLRPFHVVHPGEPAPEGLALALPSSPYLLERVVRERLPENDVLFERAEGYGFYATPIDAMSLSLDDEGDEGVAGFAVSLGLRVGGEIVEALPLVLAALRASDLTLEGPLLLALPDGRTLEVPAERLKPLRAILLELAALPDGAKLARVRALGLDPSMLARSPASLERLRRALATSRDIEGEPIPPKLRATLRGYQAQGFRWLLSRRRAGLGAVLADDMGLGKTIQAISLFLAEAREGKPSLVVCPKSVLGNWEAELARFAPELTVHAHHGAARQASASRIPESDVVLTTYPLLVRDASLLEGLSFSTVVLDEAQNIKTAGSTYAHAACKLRAEFRLALSGTPMENHLGELWSVLRFVLPELLGDSRSFAKAFRRPIERDGDDETRRSLIARIAPFLLRRLKEQVARELPQKTLIVEPIELDDAQRDVYESVRAVMDERVQDALREKGLARSHIVLLDALLKLRQVVCDPRLLATRTAKKAGSAKLETLVAKLEELVAEGRRVLVFSQFVSMLELIEKELRKAKIRYLLLTGQTEHRGDLVAAFQRGDAPVFLLSLKAGGSGLNLTAADVVIHYDPWWNPAAEAQATDRAHRIGQDKPVFVYKLVGKDTIEEKILALQAKKHALFSSILDDDHASPKGVARALTTEDVAFLFAR